MADEVFVFDRVQVDHLTQFSARVTWALHRLCPFDPPYTFYVEWSPTGLPEGDDWETVSEALVNEFAFLDRGRRRSNLDLTSWYRVRLDRDGQSYYSAPTSIYGLLDRRQWLLASEIARRTLLLFEDHAAVVGYLFKRRRRRGADPTEPMDPTTDPADVYMDPLTGEIIRTSPTPAAGTDNVPGWVGPTRYAMLIGPQTRLNTRDPERGTVEDISTSALGWAFPMPETGDVFVDAQSDRRYYIHAVQEASVFRNVPLLVRAELRLAPLDDPVYTLAVPEWDVEQAGTLFPIIGLGFPLAGQV